MERDEDMVDDELVELFTEVVKHQFKAAEKSEDMVENYTVDEINASASVAVENIYESLDTEKRRNRLYLLVAKIGESIGSESMAEFGLKNLKEAMQNAEE